jgi:hypothetical protein
VTFARPTDGGWLATTCVLASVVLLGLLVVVAALAPERHYLRRLWPEVEQARRQLIIDYKTGKAAHS